MYCLSNCRLALCFVLLSVQHGICIMRYMNKSLISHRHHDQLPIVVWHMFAVLLCMPTDIARLLTPYNRAQYVWSIWIPSILCMYLKEMQCSYSYRNLPCCYNKVILPQGVDELEHCDGKRAVNGPYTSHSWTPSFPLPHPFSH